MPIIVENKGDFIRHFGSVRLIPGTNNIDDSQVKELKDALKHPLNMYLINKGELASNSFEDLISSKNVEELEGIKSINAEKAKALIQETFSITDLEAFREQEANSDKPRKTVIEAIDERSQELTNPPEEKIFNDESDTPQVE